MVLDRKNPLVPRENKKAIFLVFGRIVSQKMFLVFPGKDLVFRSKTISLSEGEVGFHTEVNCLLEKAKKQSLESLAV